MLLLCLFVEGLPFFGENILHGHDRRLIDLFRICLRRLTSEIPGKLGCQGLPDARCGNGLFSAIHVFFYLCSFRKSCGNRYRQTVEKSEARHAFPYSPPLRSYRIRRFPTIILLHFLVQCNVFFRRNAPRKIDIHDTFHQMLPFGLLFPVHFHRNLDHVLHFMRVIIRE